MEADGAGELGDTTLVATLQSGASGGNRSILCAPRSSCRGRARRRAVLTEPRLHEGTRPRPAVGGRSHQRQGHRARGRGLEGAVRRAGVERPHRAAEQRAPRLGIRSHVQVPRGHGRGGLAAVNSVRGRRSSRASCSI
ncbi:hypothetical protein OPAG_06873 [Rhodococcus opacus PD630]|nr:hypothetical protein OPAG_06873 [Rhodococcus opacus PD630]